jgi:cytochrome c oxidase subunit 2
LRLHLPKRLRRLATVVALSSAMLLVSGCSEAEKASMKRLAQPEGVTDRTDGIHSLWMGSWLAAVLVGVVVWGLIGYACVKFYRRRDDEIPVQTRYNLPIEILYTVAPIVMVLVLFYFTVLEQNKILPAAEADSGNADHTVTVVGQQWSWTFNYDKDPALDGSTTVFDSGTPAHPPTLYLPVDKKVHFNLRSQDVIHSFWVPAFLFKLDVIPGRDNGFSLTPTREGSFAGKCAELCGTYHSRMLFDVRIVSESDYAAHLKSLQERGNIGPALGATEVDKIAGENGNSEEDGQ